MRQFYGRLEKCTLSAGKTHVHKIPRSRGGGYFGFFFWGGSADFIFMGAGIFLTIGDAPEQFKSRYVLNSSLFRSHRRLLG